MWIQDIAQYIKKEVCCLYTSNILGLSRMNVDLKDANSLT